MPASQPANFNLQEFTDIGQLLVGGRLYTYAFGTTASKTAYTDPDGTVPHTYTLDGAGGQYIALNARGELPAPLYLVDGAYDIALRRADGSTVWTRKAEGVAAPVNSLMQALETPTGASKLGFRQAGNSTVATTIEDKLRERVSAMDYMTDAERADVTAGTQLLDVTAAVQRAINATAPGGVLIWPKGSYKVTTLDTGRLEATWDFDHAEIVAGAAVATDCVLRFKGLHCNIKGMKINGNFNLNYGCLLWWYNAAESSQHNNFFGLDIRYAKRGIVFGALPGQASTGYAQSENTIFGLHVRGVERPLYMNHSNGVLSLASPTLASHDDDWAAFAPNKFDKTLNYAFEAFGGVLLLDGGELQNSVADVSSYCAVLQGGEVYLNDVITEVDTPFLLSGELIIDGGRVLNTQSVTDQFVIQAGANAKSKLKVSNAKLFRNDGVGSFSARQLVKNTGSAQGIDVTFHNCDVIEWGSFVPLVAANHQSAHFDNVRWYPNGLQDPHYAVYLLDTHGADILDRPGFDTSGGSSTGFYQSVWYGGGSTWTVSADAPNGNFRGSLACNSTGQAGWFTVDPTSLATIQATAFSVKPGDKFLVECWIKFVGGNAQAGAGVVLYDAAGNQLATPYVRAFDQNNFVTAAWQYLRNVIEIPAGAAYAGFGAQGIQSEVRFAGLKVRRADWNVL